MNTNDEKVLPPGEVKMVLLPLSGKQKPDAIDTEILLADRAALEALAQAILQNTRLATAIAHAWLSQQDLQVSPKAWNQERLERRLAEEGVAL